jgi:hypothetical protein
MTRTTRLCILAGAIYVLLFGVLLIVLRNVVPDKEPDLTLCPFCHK